MPGITPTAIMSDGFYVPPDDDAKAFVTYRNYTDAFLWLVEDLYPTNADFANTVKGLPAYSRSKPANVNDEAVANQLLGAWSTEVLMAESLRVSSDVAIRYANVWSPVQAYYAVFSATLAWLKSFGDQATAHKAVLNVATSEFQRGELNISPWSAACSGCSVLGQEAYSSIPGDTNLAVNNLQAPRSQQDAWGLVAKSLKTTRTEMIQESFTGWLKGQKTATGQPRKNVPRAVKEQIGNRFPVTSWLHLLYRMRIRQTIKKQIHLLWALSILVRPKLFTRVSCGLRQRTSF